MADRSAPLPPPKWYYQPWSVVLLLLFVLGPFGLPLLWKSPAFSRGMKLTLTIVVLAHIPSFGRGSEGAADKSALPSRMAYRFNDLPPKRQGP